VTFFLYVTANLNFILNLNSKKTYLLSNFVLFISTINLKLYQYQVFDDATYLDEQNNPELVKEAKQILKKCGGLPLAIVVIGGFLANRPKNAEEWRQLNENINAELEMNPKLGMIRTVLEKSYDGLPYHLKSCFFISVHFS